jgi:thiol peroxidase
LTRLHHRGATCVRTVTTLSDYRDASFGEAYGLLIKELRLLARVVLVVDKDGKVQYTELVPEIFKEPDDNEALFDIKRLI